MDSTISSHSQSLIWRNFWKLPANQSRPTLWPCSASPQSWTSLTTARTTQTRLEVKSLNQSLNRTRVLMLRWRKKPKWRWKRLFSRGTPGFWLRIRRLYKSISPCQIRGLTAVSIWRIPPRVQKKKKNWITRATKTTGCLTPSQKMCTSMASWGKPW
jgi:hypothetical protein